MQSDSESSSAPPYGWRSRLADAYVLEVANPSGKYRVVVHRKGFRDQESFGKLLLPHTVFFAWEAFRQLRWLTYHRMRWIVQVQVYVAGSWQPKDTIEVKPKREAFERVHRQADALRTGVDDA